MRHQDNRILRRAASCATASYAQWPAGTSMNGLAANAGAAKATSAITANTAKNFFILMYNPLGCFFVFLYRRRSARGSPLNRNKSPRFPLLCHQLPPLFHICLIILLSFIGGGCRAPPFLPSRVFAEVQAIWGPNCQDSDLCG